MSPEDIEVWQRRRDEARGQQQFREAKTGLPCIQEQVPFMYADESREAARQAKELCVGCPFRANCLRDAMNAETGLRADWRSGIYGGLTGGERFKLAREAGCPVCGKDPAGERTLHCTEHAIKGAGKRRGAA